MRNLTYILGISKGNVWWSTNGLAGYYGPGSKSGSSNGVVFGVSKRLTLTRLTLASSKAKEDIGWLSTHKQNCNDEMRRDENNKFYKYGLYQPIIQTVLWLMRIGYWLFSTSISYRNLRSPLSGDCKFHLTLVRTFDQFSLFIGQFWINDTVSTFGFFGLHEFFYESRVIFGYFCIILCVCQFSKFLAQRLKLMNLAIIYYDL